MPASALPTLRARSLIGADRRRADETPGGAGVIEAYTLTISPTPLGLPIAAWLRIRPLPLQRDADILSSDIVGFDVDVGATLVIDALDLDAELDRPGRERPVVAARARMVWIDRPAQRLCPEARGTIDVVGLAIDQQAV